MILGRDPKDRLSRIGPGSISNNGKLGKPGKGHGPMAHRALLHLKSVDRTACETRILTMTAPRGWHLPSLGESRRRRRVDSPTWTPQVPAREGGKVPDVVHRPPRNVAANDLTPMPGSLVTAPGPYRSKGCDPPNAKAARAPRPRRRPLRLGEMARCCRFESDGAGKRQQHGASTAP